MSSRLSLLLLLLLSALPLWAQESPLYYPYEAGEEPSPFEVVSDTTLFYRAIGLREDLYHKLSRYRFSFVANNPREVEDRGAFRLSDLEVDRSTLRQLSMLERRGRLEGASLFWEGFERGHRLRLNLADRRYNLALRYLYGGESPSGWQANLQVEGRYGKDLHTMGVYTHSLMVGLRLQRAWTMSRLTLLAWWAPSERGLAAGSTEESFSLLNDPYYNPAWGYFRGEVRSGRVARESIPTLLAGFEHQLSPSTSLRLTLLGRLGLSRLSSPGWFDAATPRPDYYRNLPSAYADPEVAEQVADRWRQHDSRYTQIDWDELYRRNRLAGGEARYLEQDRVERLSEVRMALLATSQVGSSLELSYGVEGYYERRRHYLEVRDLLGADYLIDLDYYLLDGDSYSSLLENDLQHPGRRVGEGERFSHDYAFDRHALLATFKARYRLSALMLEGGVRLGEEALSRVGFFEKELFAGSRSLGRSAWLVMPRYEFSFEAKYPFAPHHHLALELDYSSRPPQSDDLFLQPQYNNRWVDHPSSMGAFRGRLSYQHHRERWELLLALRIDHSHHGTESVRYYDDLSASYADRVVSGIGTLLYGVEGAFSWRPHRRLSLEFTASLLGSSYVGAPRVSLYDDRSNELLLKGARSYMGECHLGGIPHLRLSAAVGYYGSKWGVKLDLAYAAMRYVHPDFMRRTVRVAGAAASPEAFYELMNQASLSAAFRADLSLWKRFALGSRASLLLSARVNNLMGVRTTPYDSYEAYRVRRLSVGDGYDYLPLGNRLSYASPRSLTFSVTFTY